MDSNIVVYSYRRCPFAIRVRMVLHEKGIPFDTIEEDLGHFSPELQKLHPEARVPVLVHGELPIYESCIITEYLEDAFPQQPLMPKTPQDRMKVRQWTYWCNQLFKPEIDRFKYGANTMTPGEMEDAKLKLGDCLKKLEAQLKQSPWLVGEMFSLADIHVFPFYRQLTKVTPPHPEITLYPAIDAWLEGIISRPAFEKTMEK